MANQTETAHWSDYESNADYRRKNWRHSLSNYQDGPDDDAEALRSLIYTRAPDLDALREKVAIVRQDVGLVPMTTVFTQILADIDGLN